ncbi:MAG: hypothetical protein LUD48_07090 [Prevotella sp.]|nr:hypothetical protein [Prevotella sp.]
MKIYVSKAKDPSYYGQVGIRVGKKVSSMNVIYFGKHSELLKEHDDPRAYVKSEIAKWNEENKNRRFFDVKYNLDEKVENVDNEEGESTETNVGYFYLQYIMKDLKLKEYTTTHYKDYEFEYDAFDILRFLVYDRIIDPDSKLAESKELNCYYGNFDFGYYDILRFMDVLVGDEDHKNEESYLKWLYKKSNKIVKRDLTTLYFDGTNFYCETDGPDQYFVDPDTGEILALPRPMRRYGISKEHRPNPIVQMGLFTDTDGIPITMCLSPGNTAECTTAIPLEEQVCDMLQDDKTDFVYCADGSLGTYNIRKFNSMGGRHFVVSQSCKELKDVFKKALFNDYDYRLLSDDTPITIAEL